jgi:hypothetical protein
MKRRMRNALIGNPVQHRRRHPGQSVRSVAQYQFADDVVLARNQESRPAYITRDGATGVAARPINAIPFRWVIPTLA